MAEKLTVEQAKAYEIVADWHNRQARGFRDMSKDEPRIDVVTRARALQAAIHHDGSAAALRLAAYDARRAALALSKKDETNG